jgi:hypothetical protein
MTAAAQRQHNDAVHHPAHYLQGGLEVIDVIEHWGLSVSFHLANAVKYILRHQAKGRPIEDLGKALWYVERAQRGAGFAVHAAVSVDIHDTYAHSRVNEAFAVPTRLGLALVCIRRAACNRYLRKSLLQEAAIHLREHRAELSVGA